MAAHDARSRSRFSIDPISAGQRPEPKTSEQSLWIVLVAITESHENAENASGLSVRIRSDHKLFSLASRDAMTITACVVGSCLI
jgi:hypothetical protein